MIRLHFYILRAYVGYIHRFGCIHNIYDLRILVVLIRLVVWCFWFVFFFLGFVMILIW